MADRALELPGQCCSFGVCGDDDADLQTPRPAINDTDRVILSLKTQRKKLEDQDKLVRIMHTSCARTRVLHWGPRTLHFQGGWAQLDNGPEWLVGPCMPMPGLPRPWTHACLFQIC